MAEIDVALSSYKGIVAEIGKAAIHTLFPNEFEYYMVGLELVDSKQETNELFLFPVMPEKIRVTEPTLTNVKKTAGGVTTLNTNSFVPHDITISGTFGRKFKFVSNQAFNFSGFRFSTENGFSLRNFGEYVGTQLKNTTFNNVVKTGYGCFKLLESICSKSKGLDRYNNPYSLYLYLNAIGNSYVAEVIDFSGEMTAQKNMIWDYDLRLKGVGLLNNIFDDRFNIVRNLTFNFIDKKATKLISEIRNVVVDNVFS